MKMSDGMLDHYNVSTRKLDGRNSRLPAAKTCAIVDTRAAAGHAHPHSSPATRPLN
jgi:hypothetical protein